MLNKKILISILLVIALFFTGCVSPRAVYYQNLNNLVRQKNYEGASSLAEKSKYKVYKKKNSLLYYLDRGMLLHLSGRYEESNIAFEKAKSIAADHFTKSITSRAATLLVSDNMRPYYGEYFERALIHLFSALNYFLLGNESAALVEARQVDHFLKTIKTNYAHKITYTEDPFIRYLMGMIYENQGEINNAYISYYKALKAYEKYESILGIGSPDYLVQDTLRCAKKLGFRSEISEIQKRWKQNLKDIKLGSSYGELIVLHYNGLCPFKVDDIFEISFGKAWIYAGKFELKGDERSKKEEADAIARTILAEEQVRIAFPKYVESDYRIKSFSAYINKGDEEIELQGKLVHNLGYVAEKSLEDRIKSIRARAIARAAIKFTLAHKAAQKVEKDSGDKALAWLTKKVLSAAATATEKADKRSWRSLPDEIGMVKLFLPEGAHDVHLVFRDDAGNVIDEVLIDKIVIKRGKKTFEIVRTAL